MNKELKELAEQAGLDPCVFYDNLLRLSDFAELVRRDEREVCAKLCDNLVIANSYQGNYVSNTDFSKEIRARGEK
jgi:hypothetical protein